MYTIAYDDTSAINKLLRLESRERKRAGEKNACNHGYLLYSNQLSPVEPRIEIEGRDTRHEATRRRSSRPPNTTRASSEPRQSSRTFIMMTMLYIHINDWIAYARVIMVVMVVEEPLARVVGERASEFRSTTRHARTHARDTWNKSLCHLYCIPTK